MKESSYYKKIDGLRFVAVSLVLLQHFADYIVNRIFAGFFGVNLFFVISGFLVTKSLLSSPDKGFKSSYLNFIYRRALRIFPLYYISIFILYFVIEQARQSILYLATYTFNYYYVGHDVSGIGHLWSLSVEEQFYLLLPFIVLPLRNRQNTLFWVMVCIIIAGFTQFIFSIIPSISRYNKVSLFTMMPQLGMGVLGALINNKNKIFYLKWVEYAVAIIVVFSLITPYRSREVVLTLCSLYIVIKAAYYGFNIRFVNTILLNKTVVYIGKISYGIYIFHFPLYFLFEQQVTAFWKQIDFSFLGRLQVIHYHPWTIKLVLFSLLAAALAAISYKYIERPFLRLKNNLR